MENQELKKELALKWMKAKAKEEKANEERVAIEKELEDLYSSMLPVEGSTTIKEEDFKIVFNKGFTWSLDTDQYIQLIPEIPENLRPHRIKLELDKKGWDYIINHCDNEEINDIYRKVSPCISLKPKKTGVKIEKI